MIVTTQRSNDSYYATIAVVKQNNFFVQVSYDIDNVPKLAKLHPLKVQEGGS